MKIINRLWIIWLSIIQLLGFSSKLVYSLRKEPKNYVLKRKGHQLLNPTEEQVKGIYLSLANKMSVGKSLILNQYDLYDTPKWGDRSESLIDKIVIYSSETEGIPTHELRDIDMSTSNTVTPRVGLPSLAAHFFIHKNGIIEVINKNTRMIPHSPRHMTRGIGVMFEYRLAEVNIQTPNQKTIDSIVKMVALLILEYKLDPRKAIVSQSETRKWYLPNGKFRGNKLQNNPGPLIHMGWFKQQVIIKVQRMLKNTGYYFGEVTGFMNKETKNAIVKFNSPAISVYYEEFGEEGI